MTKQKKNYIKNCNKRYYQTHKEEFKIHNKQYRQEHEEQKRIDDKQYRQDHKEQISNRMKRYYQIHKESYEQYYQMHKEQIKVYHKKYFQTPEGKIMNKRHYNRRHRSLGFEPLNEWQLGYVAHHINLKKVIYMPEVLHESIPHNVITGKNMHIINAIAINYWI
jgi:hypothetical protein